MGDFRLDERLSHTGAGVIAPRDLCLGPPGAKHLSGGACLGLAISALEAATERPLIAASAQFVAPIKAGDAFQIETMIAKSGRTIVQASAAHVRDNIRCVTVFAALGASEGPGMLQWDTAPSAPPPEQCEDLPFIRMDEDDLHSHLDVRAIPGAGGRGKGGLAFWVRIDGGVTAAALAALGDYLPECIHWSLGRPAGATSLDNNIRIVAREPTEWILCASQLSSISGGLFHGRMSLFARSGALLAIASQSGVVRDMKAR